MSSIAKLVGRLQQVPRLTRLLKESRGLINTTDLLVATAATVVLAAGIGGAAVGTLDEANYGKAQPDAQVIAQAINTFYKDTGRWPGQAYHATTAGLAQAVVLATGAYNAASSTSAFVLPQVANEGLKWAALSGTNEKCAANSGQGFVNVSVVGHASNTSTAALDAIPSVKVLNLNDYLVRRPDSTDYPNWGGPYVQEISQDPWNRSWVAYLTPLYCSEAITTTDASGDLGYAWLISGGTNRTITTMATSSNLDLNGDDAGVNLGKRSVQTETASQ